MALPLFVIFLVIFKTCTGDDTDTPDDVSNEGLIGIEPRIAGGRSVKPGDIPYHFQLRYLDDYHCGAALIISDHGNQVIITAARCVVDKSGNNLLNARQLSVVGGRVRRNGRHYYEQFRGVTKITIHPRWRRTSTFAYNDVGVLHIDSPFELNRLVQPLPLIDREVKPTGKVIISGWGFINPSESGYADYLQVATLDVVPNPKCKSYYSDIQKVDDDHFCAGIHRNPTFQGACKGDTGSPATNIYNNTLYLVGVFNYGEPKCGNRFLPSVYTDLSYFLRWIQNTAEPLSRSAAVESYGNLDGLGYHIGGRDDVDDDDTTTGSESEGAPPPK